MDTQVQNYQFCVFIYFISIHRTNKEISFCEMFYDHIISYSVPLKNSSTVFHSAVKMLSCMKLSRTLERKAAVEVQLPAS